MSKPSKIVVVGAVAAGGSAAARCRRLSEEAEIIVLDKGQYPSFANCGLPYYIGGVITDREELLITPEETMRLQYNFDLRMNSEVVKIDRENKRVVVKKVITGETYEESYEKLILSPGAAPFVPPVPGADLPEVRTLRSMSDMDRIRELAVNTEISPRRKAVVVGAGFVGLEVAENLADLGIEVTIVELLDQISAVFDKEMTIPCLRELEAHGIKVLLSHQCTAFERASNGQGLVVKVKPELEVDIEADFVVMAIGVRPEDGVAREAGLEMGPRGGIVVDEHMCTSDPDIYAAGDAVLVKDFVTGDVIHVPLAGPANRQGRIAANHMFGEKTSITFRGSQGTSILKVFGRSIGSTGLIERRLKNAGMKYEKLYMHCPSNAKYYPGWSWMVVKILFNPETYKVLGGQVVGGERGVDKKIDALAMAVQMGATMYDLEEVEFSYAPPFGSAKDGLNMAGFMMTNMIHHGVRYTHFSLDWKLRWRADDDKTSVLIDLRLPEELEEEGTYPGEPGKDVLNIPLEYLRERIDEIPRDRRIVVGCRTGIRAYFGERILTQKGFKEVFVLGGSVRSYIELFRQTRRAFTGSNVVGQ